MKSILLFVICLTFIINKTLSEIEDNEIYNGCNLNKSLLQEIKSYAPIANKIIKAIVEEKYKSSTYNHLATFVDKFGPRFTGTENLENAIDYMINISNVYNLENVRYENVTVPQWIRGTEFAHLILPRGHVMRILGLGYSVGTPEEGIRADAIVVKDFDELKKLGDRVKNKIVVYDQKYISYPDTVIYRSKGASEAAKYGAVAALINSITPYSLNTPHTGMQSYEEGVKKIPVACITPQDANMLRRMQNRAERLHIHLKMDARMHEPKISRNTIAEIQGNSLPDKVVLVSGHIDSWDVGQGAMDDGGGAFLSWNSLVILKSLGLRPRRTLRVVLWTAEEMGLIGAQAYFKAHQHELEKFNFVMESDIGTFKPVGLGVSGTNEAVCIVKEVLSLLEPINATTIRKPAEGPDIDFFTEKGVPGGNLLTKNDPYFIYHHSEADTIEIENPYELDLATALWATVSFVIADLSIDLPKILLHN